MATGPDNHHAHLVRGIGFLGLAILVINSVIGAGIFALPAAVTARAGVLSPWLFLAVGLIIFTIVLTLAELASYFTASGGPVLYTTTAFGPLAGFSTGWLLFVSRVVAFGANSNAMADYLGAIWPWFFEGAGRVVLIAIVAVSLTYANYVGVRKGVGTMAVITFFKVMPIVLLILLGLQYVSGDTLFPEVFPTIDDIGGTTLLLVYAYVGFEAVTTVAGEARQPKRSVPSSLVTTVIVTGILYFLVVLVYISVLPDASASGATLIDVGRELMGPAGTVLITLAAFFSIGGNLASIMLSVPRMSFALAEQRMLPKWFGSIHDRYSTPGNSILFLGAFSLAFALTGSFAYLAAASSLTRLIGYGLCIAALPVIRNKATPEERSAAWRLKGGYTIPAAAMILCLWMATHANVESWQVTGGLLAAGLLLYVLAGRRRARWQAQASGD